MRLNIQVEVETEQEARMLMSDIREINASAKGFLANTIPL